MGFQYETAMHDETVKQGNRGPYNYEQLWKPETQAAYLLPALRNFSNGPSGFTAYPGVGLSDRYKGHFFLANFSGSPGNSGIYSFATKPKGASFEMVDDHKFMWNILATDCEFGPDGAFYVSDWVDGWNLPNKGRIYKVTDAEAMKNPAVAEAKKLMAEGMEKRSVEELLKLLGHPQRQVRMEAQFALAGRGSKAVAGLASALASSSQRLVRLHALWALGEIARRQGQGDVRHSASKPIQQLLADKDPIVRSAAAKELGEIGVGIAVLEPLLNDSDHRVQMAAALALRRANGGNSPVPQTRPVGTDDPSKEVRTQLFDMLRGDASTDPYLRNSIAIALAHCVSTDQLKTAVDDKSSSVRVAAVVALRRQKAPEVAAFLNDGDPKIVAEAARAINDVPIPAAMPQARCSHHQAGLAADHRLSRAQRPVPARQAGECSGDRCLCGSAGRARTRCEPWPCGCSANGPKPPRRDYITGLTQALPARPQLTRRTRSRHVIGKTLRRTGASAQGSDHGGHQARHQGSRAVPDRDRERREGGAEQPRRGAQCTRGAQRPKLQETAKTAVSTGDPQSSLRGPSDSHQEGPGRCDEAIASKCWPARMSSNSKARCRSSPRTHRPMPMR